MLFLYREIIQLRPHGFAQASEAAVLKGQAVPLHAGLWGLARCLRLESPGSVAGCVDLGPLEKLGCC